MIEWMNEWNKIKSALQERKIAGTRVGYTCVMCLRDISMWMGLIFLHIKCEDTCKLIYGYLYTQHNLWIAHQTPFQGWINSGPKQHVVIDDCQFWPYIVSYSTHYSDKRIVCV